MPNAPRAVHRLSYRAAGSSPTKRPYPRDGANLAVAPATTALALLRDLQKRSPSALPPGPQRASVVRPPPLGARRLREQALVFRSLLLPFHYARVPANPASPLSKSSLPRCIPPLLPGILPEAPLHQNPAPGGARYSASRLGSSLERFFSGIRSTPPASSANT